MKTKNGAIVFVCFQIEMKINKSPSHTDTSSFVSFFFSFFFHSSFYYCTLPFVTVILAARPPGASQLVKPL